MEGLNQGYDGGVILMTGLHSHNVGIGLGEVGGGVLGDQGILSGIQTTLQA